MGKNKVGACSVQGCDKYGPLTKTWCTRHYARQRRTGQIGPPGTLNSPRNSSFGELIKYHGYDEVEGCWVANGVKNDDGYIIWNTGGEKVSAHRVSYTHYKGPIPKGLSVMHSCDVRPCMNPGHLSIGTHRDNMLDCARKGRSPMAKLVKEEVVEIRKLINAGKTDDEIGRMFEVTGSTIYQIRVGNNWKWLK